MRVTVRSLLKLRAPVGLALVFLTVLMGYWASRVRIATSFEDFFPKNDPNIEIYQKFRRVYGGAETVTVMLRVKHGDIFNANTLKKIYGLQQDVDGLPGVNHQEVFSLASPRVYYTTVVPGALLLKDFMSSGAPINEQDIQSLKHLVEVHRGEVQGLVSNDNHAAVVHAAFGERWLDYHQLFNQLQAIKKKHEDTNNEIFLAGEPVVRGYGYYYLPLIGILFTLAVAAMIFLLYLRLGSYTMWWIPVITGSCSALWGIGFAGFKGYDFDPLMLVVPFILSARDFSHGIQWQGRYHDELQKLGDKYQACAETTNAMLPPGLLSILADIAGIIFISLGGIPVLQHLAYVGTVWLASSLAMVFIFQPILMSYLPVPQRKPGAGLLARMAPQKLQEMLRASTEWLVHLPIRKGPVRWVLIWGSVGFVVLGVISGARAKVGYSSLGTPLYKSNAKVNRDLQAIARYFPLDEGWVVFESSSTFPSAGNVLDPNVLRLETDLGREMHRDPRVLGYSSFSTDIIEPFNRTFHYDFPKYFGVPSDPRLAGNLWYLYLAGTAPGEIERYISSQDCRDTCIRLSLRDHTSDTLSEVEHRLWRFFDQHLASANVPQLKIHYLSGIGGLYAAANHVLYRLDFLNITFVLLVIFVFCAVAFQSLFAAALFLFACVLANFGAFIYMRWRDIGLTIDTIPVISLGIGLGVDYGIYTVARIRDEMMEGQLLESAVVTALKTTGAAVFSTFAVMVGGIFFWAFSPAQFHNQMSLLLMFLMATNMVAGVLVLPTLLVWLRPRFVCRYEGVPEATQVVSDHERGKIEQRQKQNQSEVAGKAWL